MTDREAFDAWLSSANSYERNLWEAFQAGQARGAQQEPVAYRFKNNRGNGKFDYAYYDADQVATAYRDNCLEITPLFASPPAQPDSVTVPREPTSEMIAAGADEIQNAYASDMGLSASARYCWEAMISAQEKV
jgi:hypothetical protein